MAAGSNHTGTGTIEVEFTHPRHSDQVFIAETSPGCTGAEAIQGLLVGDEQGPFLEEPPRGRPYELVVARTSQAIAPNMTLGEAGVVSGDVIQVAQRGMGAAICG